MRKKCTRKFIVISASLILIGCGSKIDIDQAYERGVNEGKSVGYDNGYEEGYEEGQSRYEVRNICERFFL